MANMVVVSIDERLGEAEALSAAWNGDPDLARRGEAMAPGAGQAFPLDPISGAIIIGVASGVGTELILAGLKLLFGGGDSPASPVSIIVECEEGTVVKVRVERG